MLCASWERYNEDLLAECVNIVCRHVAGANELPIEVQKTVSNAVKSDSNQLSPIRATGEGWKTIWEELAISETENLNTPKSEQLNAMFSKYLGITCYSYLWPGNSHADMDAFVTVRGEIAHRGSHAQYVRLKDLQKSIDLVISTAIEIDGKIAEYLRTQFGLKKMPWELTYPRTLESYLEGI